MNKNFDPQNFDRAAFERLPVEQRRAILDELRALLQESQAAIPTTTPTPEPEPQPAPTIEPAATYSLPTARMRQQLARFDDLSDADQVDQLATLWEEE